MLWMRNTRLKYPQVKLLLWMRKTRLPASYSIYRARRTQNGFGQMRTISSQMHLMKGGHQRKHFPEKPGEVVPKGEGGENTGRNHRTET